MSAWQKKLETWWKEQWAKIKKAWYEANPDGPTTPEIPGDDIAIPDNPQDDPQPNSALPALGSKFLVFWIPANYWATRGEQAMRDDIAACVAQGVGYGMEMAGWADSNVFTSDARLAETIRLYKLAVTLCREGNIWIMPGILNGNCHLNKYGSKGYTITSVWPKALQLLAAVKEMGPANQIVQPLAETQTDDGVTWEKECVKQLAGFELAYNGNAGRPTSKAAGFTRLAYHPTKTSEKVPAGSLAVSDCGSIILQLHGTYDGKAKADSLKAWARKCHADGAILAADYAFKYNGPADTEAIKAIAAAALAVNGASGPVAQPVVASDPIDLSAVKWKHFNVSAWPATATLTATINKTDIELLSDKRDVWPAMAGDAKSCNANAWAFYFRDGKWQAQTWEWIVKGRTNRKVKDAVNECGLKSGETVYLMVSSPARDTRRTVNERSNLFKVVWP